EGEPCVPLAQPSVFVNEVLVDDVSGLVDETGAHEPWIELYNAGAAVDLDGLRLADNAALLASWPLAGTLDAGAFLVVFADEQPQDGPEHASFRVTSSTDEIVLLDRCGTVFQTFALAGNGADVSVGLVPDGDASAAAVPLTPTPGAPNAL